MGIIQWGLGSGVQSLQMHFAEEKKITHFTSQSFIEGPWFHTIVQGFLFYLTTLFASTNKQYKFSQF